MPEYRHTQPGAFMRWTLGLGALSAVIGIAFMRESKSGVVVAFVAGILFVALLLFHSLRVEVTSTDLRLVFGIGLIRKTFSIGEIVSAVAVTNRWYYGWGIRLTPHGWLYNVSGWDAVEIELRNGKKKRIGTDEPERLLEAIRSAIEGDSRAT